MVLVNVILLYGKQVCARLDSLVTHWSTVIADYQWADYLFVLLDQEKPTLPEALANAIAPNVLYLNTTENVNAAPINMAIMQRMAHSPDGVRLMCLCEAFSDTAVPAGVLTNLIGQIRDHFKVANLTYQLYLLLSGAEERRAHQTKVAKQLMATNPNAAFLMAMVSTTLALLPFETVLHATHSEMLANVLGRRTLTNGLYSIGTSALNADGQELKLLLENEALEQVAASAQETMTNDRAMELLTGKVGVWGANEGVLETHLHDWLAGMFAESKKLRLPNESECKMARIFANVYQRDEASIRQAVAAFFQLNTGDDKLMYEDAREKAAELERSARKRLSSQLNVAQFPPFVLDTACKVLEQLAQKPISRAPVQLPARGIMTRLNPRPYIDQCCEAFEKACTEEVRERYVRQLARAMHEKLAETRQFLSHTAGLVAALNGQRAKAATLSQLKAKYPNYSSTLEMARQTAVMHIQSALQNNDRLLLSSAGEVRADDVKVVCRHVQQLISERLPTAYRGSFWNALAEECSGDGKLQQFFESYLATGTRLFHSLHDLPTPPESLYLTDSAFAGTPWGRQQSSKVLLANTDNVERMDLYTLRRTFEEYLAEENSFYFDEKQAAQMNMGGFATMNVHPAKPAPQRPASVGVEEAAEKPDNTHGITLRHTAGDRYFLKWNWKGGETAATVYLSRNGTPIGYPLPVNSAPFFADDGVDITDRLHQLGAVDVSVVYGGYIYAQGKVSGKQMCVTWKRARDSRGNNMLILEGNPSDINKVVVHSGHIYYPLYATQTPMEYKGFAGNCTPTLNPHDPYPSVYLKNL